MCNQLRQEIVENPNDDQGKTGFEVQQIQGRHKSVFKGTNNSYLKFSIEEDFRTFDDGSEFVEKVKMN